MSIGKRRNAGAVSLLLMCCFTLSARAEMVTFTDFSGDGVSTNVGDVVSVELDFDPTTGDYTATWTAHEDDPFVGNLEFWLNLQNSSIPGGDDAFPELLGRKLYGVSETTSLAYSGVDTDLVGWAIDDVILCSGTFPGTFSTGYFHSALKEADVSVTAINVDFLHQVQSVVTEAEIAPVPTPTATILGLLGLATAGAKLRRRREAK